MDVTSVISFFLLGAAGALVPIALMRVLPDSQKGLIVAILCSIILIKLFGAALFAWTYASDVGFEAISGATSYFWSLGGRASLIWGPILALTSFCLATGIERRKGERIAARDPE